MKTSPLPLLLLVMAAYASANGQRLKKADRTIVANMESHIAYLSKRDAHSTVNSRDESAASEYVRKQFERSGLKPAGNNGSWYQGFNINEGKNIDAGTRFSINGRQLTLHQEFFPFAFSSSQSTEATVAIALAENDVPWFKDLKDLLEEKEVAVRDTMEIIRAKAAYAAEKGATALIIYNSTGPDLNFDKRLSGATAAIPVLYISKPVYQQYCTDESAILDVKLNVALSEKNRHSANVIGYADHGADSTIIAGASMENNAHVAALIELARLVKNASFKKKNYLFVAYSPEEHGQKGMRYFNEHPTINLQQVGNNILLDSISAESEKRKGLLLVKNSMSILQPK